MQETSAVELSNPIHPIPSVTSLQHRISICKHRRCGLTGLRWGNDKVELVKTAIDNLVAGHACAVVGRRSKL